MAPARKLANGRSPLVNQQRQITSFFTKTSSSSPSPSPSPTLSKQATPKSDLIPNPETKIPNLTSSPSSPTTPSPHQTKPNKKPLLVIGPSTPVTPDCAAKQSIGEEVVNKRVKVYWPLDQSWYEGCVKSFDKLNGKHLVQYDDAEEEELDLTKEKIEWVDDKSRGLRRLRRASLVVDDDDDDEVEEKVVEEEVESGGDDDDSTDEDWGKSAAIEVVDDGSEDMDLDEEEDEDKAAESAKRTRNNGSVSRKRKMSGGEKLGSGKKSKSGGNVEKLGLKVSLNCNGGKVKELKKNSDSE